MIARLLFLRRIRVINVKVLIKLVKFSEYEELVKGLNFLKKILRKKILKLCP